MAIPGTILKIRHYSMALTFMSVCICVYELLRYSLTFGPLPANHNYVLVWTIFMSIGSLIGLGGAFMLQHSMLLAGSLFFCCLMAPVTPNMIVLTQGDQSEYFIMLTLFQFVVGALLVLLYAHLSEELSVREALRGQPTQLGNLRSNAAS
mmetsp:Transcript_17233/g.21762  ORF Transcript_17233/g.21762 Transcript_17233/m.21762 type:complete len:150 (-) Transcript_17233:229-678(-)